MDKIVDLYQDKLYFDNNPDGVLIHVFKNKEDLLNKYVISNLFNMKLDEPIRGESYDENFKRYLEELKSLSAYMGEEQQIIIALFGVYENIDIKDIQNIDTRVYSIKDFEVLISDIKDFYNN